MAESLQKIIALIKKEFIVIWKDPKSRGIIIALPLVQLILFAHAVTMEVKNIDFVVVDLDNSLQSRELISKFENSPQFRHVHKVAGIAEMQKEIDDPNVEMGLCINNDFSTNITSKTPTEVLVITDGRQTNTAAIIAGYATQIIRSYNEEIASTTGAKINIITRNWYNPNLEYRWFTLTVVVAMLAVVMTILLTALSIAREREMGTFDQLIVSPLSSLDILIGKTIPPLTIAMILMCLMSIAVTQFFGVPFNGSVILFLWSMLVALLSIVGVGLFISSISSTQQQAVLGCITFMMPAVLLSGFVSPVEDMPVFLQYFTYLNPMRFFIVLTRGIFLKGMSITDVTINLIPLLFTAAITLSLAAWTFKRQQG
ncbi:MAG: ABC transporter permease [Alphaproteobacteria bacterium]|nr:ABC transporter permease [Alphaproteobacteria bacterium]